MKNSIKITLAIIIAFLSGNLFAGGFIIVSPPGTNGFIASGINPYSLEVRSLKVTVDIKGQIATTTIEEVFYNPSNSNLQGWFLFPVPKGAVLQNFAMEINGKLTPAELLPADKARGIYEGIVRSMQDPALLEYSGQDLFKVRIFPIEAQKEKRIKISYTEILQPEDNIYEYTFPLNTEKYSAKPLNNVSFKIDIQEESRIITLYSPSHNTENIQQSDKKAVVGFEAKEIKPDKDFNLFIGTAVTPVGLSSLSYKKQGEDGFFLLNISPGFVSDKDQLINKDITFVLDVSGSMAGEKMEQAKKALKFCVANLNDNDKFEIIRFSTLSSALFGKRVVANKSNRYDANKFIDDLKAIGGTNMEEALGLACIEKADPTRPHMIVFITDGKPTIGKTKNEELLKQISTSNSDNTRIFTFGIGDEINTHLLDLITEQTRAYRSYISPDEDIEVKVSNFFTKVSSPVLTDLHLTASGSGKIEEIFPLNLPDLFKGSSITVLGRFKAAGQTELILTGKVNGKEKIFKYNINFKEQQDNEFIPVLWATRKVGFLLDQIRLNGSSKELVDEVTSLAKEYGIITPYTSYLILEDEQINIADNNLAPTDAIFNNRFSGVEDQEKFNESRKEDFKNMSIQSGGASIKTSKDFQKFRSTSNLLSQTENEETMVYTDVNGKQQNFASQTRNIQGRAIYQSGNKWIDSQSQNTNEKPERIEFLSKKYFDLLQQYPEISKFYALGQNVDFIYNKKYYQIYSK